jgi:hypothetical protein
VGGNIHNNEIWVIKIIVIRDRNYAEHSVIFRKRKSPLDKTGMYGEIDS